MSSVAIILASGRGNRMGAGKNKVLLSLNKKPMVCWAIEAFTRCENIRHIILVVQSAEKALFEQIIQRYNLSVSSVISGGETRQESAHQAVLHVQQNKIASPDSVLLFHNAANPFVTQNEIEECIHEAQLHGASVVAHPVKDTIKEVADDGTVVRTLERKQLWAMQTPQAITCAVAEEAFLRAHEEGFVGTDDVSLVERIGKDVKVIMASPRNFKITTPLDMELAISIAKTMEGEQI